MTRNRQCLPRSLCRGHRGCPGDSVKAAMGRKEGAGCRPFSHFTGYKTQQRAVLAA